MKKLLVLAAVLSMGQASAFVNPFAAKPAPAPVVEAPKVGCFKKVVNMPKNAVKSTLSALEAKVVANPKMAVLVAAVVAIVAEHAAVYAYNNFVAQDADDNDEDLDIA